jgi:protein-tyrosine phosphatase
MAMAILQQRADAAGMAIEVSSAGTHDWQTGRPAHPHTIAELSAHGIELDHAARTFHADDFADVDLVLAMDARNAGDLRRLAPTRGGRAKIYLIRDFDPSRPHDREVPDPYYGGPGDYQRVFDMLDAASAGLIARIRTGGPPPWTHP